MAEQEQPAIYVSIAASMDDDIVQPLADTLAHPRLSLRTEPRSGGDFYAGVELLMATGAVVYLAKSYFDGFLKEAGKDHYQLLKRGFGALWSRFFGSDRIVRTTASANPPEKVSSAPRYSLALSLVALDGEGQRFKLLFEETLTKDELEAAVERFQRFIADSLEGRPNALVRKQIARLPHVSSIVLLAYDPGTGELRVVDHRTGAPVPPETTEK